MYEWLEKEISEIKTPKFHIIEGIKAGKILDTYTEWISCLPPSYLEFITKFGGAKLYRRNNYYQVGVLNLPQEKTLNNGEKLFLFGYFDDAKAYFICSQLQSEQESSIYEWTEDSLEKVADSFEEWLIMRCTDMRRSYSEKEWNDILQTGKILTDEEKAIMEATKQFQWQVMEFNSSRKVKLELINNSNMVLQKLIIGMRTKNLTQDGQIWESGIYLNVSDIQPGQKSIIEHQIHQLIFTPDNTEFFAINPYLYLLEN